MATSEQRLMRYHGLNGEAAEIVMRHCAADPQWWADRFVTGFQPGIGPHMMQPWPYQRRLLQAITGTIPYAAPGQRWPLAVDKSREVGATWWAIASIIHKFLFRPQADYGMMTRSGTELDSDSTQSLFGKARHLLNHIPRWMRPKVRRVKSPQPGLINESTGNTFMGSKTVEDAFRGGRLEDLLVDECASVPWLSGVLRSIQDVCPYPTLITTPKGRSGAFAEIIFGERGSVLEWGQTGLGWLHLRFHYSERPDRDPNTQEGKEWAMRARSTRTQEDWAQEQEIDYNASMPGRIWPEFQPSVHCYSQEEWAEVSQILTASQAQIIEAWDFGSGPDALTACTQMAHLASNDICYFLDYGCWREAAYTAVAAGYRAKLANPLGRVPTERVGDIAGTARDSSQRSWIQNLKGEGIEIRGIGLRQAEGLRERIRVAFGAGKILLSPRCSRRFSQGLPTLTESIQGYRRGNLTATGETPQPVKGAGPGGEFSHLSDCVQYACSRVWGQKGKMIIL